LADEEGLRLLVHFNQGGALLIFLALFRSAFLRAGDGDTALFLYHADRLRKLAFLHFHHESEYVSTLAAAKAVKDLFNRMNCKGWSLLTVKRTKACEILAALLQPYVIADDADDVRLLFDAIRE